MSETPQSHMYRAFQEAKAWRSQITLFLWAVCSIIQRLPACENIKRVTSGQVGVCHTHTDTPIHIEKNHQHDYIMLTMDCKNDVSG